MIIYKINVLAELAARGYNTNRMRVEHILSEGTIQKLREGKMVSMDVIGRLCYLLHRPIHEIVEYIPDEPDPDHRYDRFGNPRW